MTNEAIDTALELSVDDIDALSGLTPHGQKVAMWLATPVLRPEIVPVSLRQMALNSGMPVGTAYRLQKSPQVLAAARELIKSSIETEKVPLMWQMVLNRAVKNADFALQVLKFLDSHGIDIFIGRDGASGGPKDPATFDLRVKGSLEAAIIAMRGSDGSDSDR